MARIGPLLQHVLSRLEQAEPASRGHELEVLTAQIGGSAEKEELPMVLQLAPVAPQAGETWPEFRARVARGLDPLYGAVAGGRGQPLYLANAMAVAASPQRARAMADIPEVELVELDPLRRVTLMDDVVGDIGLPILRARHGQLTGAGVSVAVLDSGIDLTHPHLRVADSASTCGETVEIPGRHGTHCAGSVASQDTIFPGVAPGVRLLNIKVLRSDGSGQPTWITKGIEAALDLGADILSMSLGFNHLPPWSDGGHGWSCPDGLCQLCMAVNNAMALGAVVCVAAGNEHERAARLRSFGFGDRFDTELACPGQARQAITVAAVTKKDYALSGFSSRGPAAYGGGKPVIAGPGVNITSTVPVPRRVDGTPDATAPRSLLFDRESGTSMATPVVAGSLALILEHRRSQGLATTPGELVDLLTRSLAAPMDAPAEAVGTGPVDLALYEPMVAQGDAGIQGSDLG